MNVSFVGSRALAAELGDVGRGVGISQVVPFPWNVGTPIVRDSQKHVALASGGDEFTFGSLEGYIAARVFVEGLRRAERELSRESFIAALETLRDFDLGGFTVTYTPGDHNGSRFVDLTVIGRDRKIIR
jgi:ABC-type branched-subunit amino acid transport system substrate-binding protein